LIFIAGGEFGAPPSVDPGVDEEGGASLGGTPGADPGASLGEVLFGSGAGGGGGGGCTVEGASGISVFWSPCCWASAVPNTRKNNKIAR